MTADSRSRRWRRPSAGWGLVILTLFAAWPLPAQPAAADSTAAARDAFVFGYPLVDGYKVLHSYTLDPASPEYKGPLNQVAHTRQVATPEDRAVVAPNVDTPYSHVWFDLRAEPVVVTLPSFERERYVSLQLIDLYTYIIGYVTPRTNGQRGGDFLLVGPRWQGTPPPGIRQVFRSPTELALGLFRTQLLNPADLGNVHRIQDQFQARPLSRYLGVAAPAASPALRPIPPIDVRSEATSMQFFAIVNWMLQYMPGIPEDAAVRANAVSIGIGPSTEFLPPAGVTDTALVAGMQQGLAAMGGRARQVRSSAELFGSREMLKDDHLIRAVGALLGIYGNSAEEFLGVGYPADAAGRPFHGAHRYRIHFPPGALPPVDAFWSLTVYTAARILYANPQKKYVINSPLLPSLKRDPDGGYTLYIQHESPGAEFEANWLPTPAEDFILTLRTYLPRAAIREGRWQAAPVQRLE